MYISFDTAASVFSYILVHSCRWTGNDCFFLSFLFASEEEIGVLIMTKFFFFFKLVAREEVEIWGQDDLVLYMLISSYLANYEKRLFSNMFRDKLNNLEIILTESFSKIIDTLNVEIASGFLRFTISLSFNCDSL